VEERQPLEQLQTDYTHRKEHYCCLAPTDRILRIQGPDANSVAVAVKNDSVAAGKKTHMDQSRRNAPRSSW
jgi:hypothetical protein